jgi:hypothetical protein
MGEGLTLSNAGLGLRTPDRDRDGLGAGRTPSRTPGRLTHRDSAGHWHWAVDLASDADSRCTAIRDLQLPSTAAQATQATKSAAMALNCTGCTLANYCREGNLMICRLDNLRSSARFSDLVRPSVCWNGIVEQWRTNTARIICGQERLLHTMDAVFLKRNRNQRSRTVNKIKRVIERK